MAKNTVYSNGFNLDNHPGILPVINHIYNTYGVKVSAQAASRYICVHGKQSDCSDSTDAGQQVMQMPTDSNGTTMTYETLPSTNAIDSIYCSNSAGLVEIWGATVNSSGEFTEVTQTINVDQGGVEHTLDTPLARVFTAKNMNSDFNWQRPVYVYESGVTFDSDNNPDDNTKIHLQSRSTQSGTGETNNSAEKAAYTVPNGYWLVFKNIDIGLAKATAAGYCDGKLQIAEFGKTFITKLPVCRGNAANIMQNDWPWLYAKPNCDIRLAAHINNSTTAELVGSFDGFLMKIID